MFSFYFGFSDGETAFPFQYRDRRFLYIISNTFKDYSIFELVYCTGSSYFSMCSQFLSSVPVILDNFPNLFFFFFFLRAKISVADITPLQQTSAFYSYTIDFRLKEPGMAFLSLPASGLILTSYCTSLLFDPNVRCSLWPSSYFCGRLVAPDSHMDYSILPSLRPPYWRRYQNPNVRPAMPGS